ncbi:MAG: FtsX-like permease family protein [Eubacteriales bacterium]
MRGKLLLDTIITIKKSFGKYLSLLLIVLMGVAFLTGMLSVSPAMGESVDRYADEYRLFDMQIYSNYGFDQDDVDALNTLDEDLQAQGGYLVDVEATYLEDSYVIRLESYEEDAIINTMELVEGTYPQAANEVLAEASNAFIDVPKIGDVVTIQRASAELDEVLSETEFIVVGLVNTPNYLSLEKGAGFLDNLTVETFLYVPAEAFIQDYYTTIYVTSDEAQALNAFEEEYTQFIEDKEEWLSTFISSQELVRGEAIYTEALDSYEEGLESYEEGFKDYEAAIEVWGEEALADALVELEQAEAELADAFREIEELEAGEWTILTREEHYGMASYTGTVEQMGVLGFIFPVFYFMVAALVCLATMTRMIDEQRGQVGVLRALGYGRFACASKFLIYALSATFIGGIIGATIGVSVFPPVIFMVWGIIYNLPPIQYAFPFVNVCIAIGAFLLLIGVATYSAIRMDTKQVPSTLLRPKAPPSGERIFLERIPFIWKRLSFTNKVTVRNLIRYKKRFFMTVIGISGCTCLLVSGFGMSDSIATISDLQYKELTLYDGIIATDDYLSEEDMDTLLTQVKEIDASVEAIAYTSYAAAVSFGEADEVGYAQVFQNQEEFSTFSLMRDSGNHTSYELDDTSLYIGDKLAELLGVSEGDEVTLEDINGETAVVTIGGVYERYINHEIYMSVSCYERLFGEVPLENAVQFSHDLEEEVIQGAILEIDHVSGITFNSSFISTFAIIAASMSIVVIMIVVSAAMLAFVVLTNLASINISERTREIATLKVLGFHPKETGSYVFKESVILTLIGAFVGAILGIFVHHFIITQVEMDYLMFVRMVSCKSILYSVLLTVIFSLGVNKFMIKKLDQINMIEALKSVE